MILAGSLYRPDSAEFVDANAAKQQLRPLAEAWTEHRGGYSSVDCIARTAAIGPPDTAMTLSQQRADAAKELLGQLGITAVHATGVGFSKPLPGIDPTDPRQRSVSCQLVPKS